MKHKHHDLIVQWAKDTTQVVEFYDGKWCVTSHPSWDEYHEYRIRHKHQDLIDQKAAWPELIVEWEQPSGEWCRSIPPHWFSDRKYRLVEPEPEKKKVKMWQWIVKFDDGQYFTTHKFYKSEAEEIADQGQRYKVIKRADWTEIEVEE